MLNVLTRLVAQEPAQADLLDQIVTGPTLSADVLRDGGAFDALPAPAPRGKVKDPSQTGLDL